MGRALAAPGKRDQVFLMTKVCARDDEGVKRQLEDALRRLRTDRIDLLQFHAIQYADDPERVFDPERGGMKAALEARKTGKIRFLGFSGHRDPQTHLRMIGMHPWDSVQMPLNLLDAQYRSFEKQGPARVPGEGHRRPRHEVARRAGRPAAPRPEARLGALPALRDVAPGRHDHLRHADPRGDAGHGANRAGFAPLTAPEVERLLGVAKGPAGDGHVEEYKDPKGGYGCSYHDAVLKAEA